MGMPCTFAPQGAILVDSGPILQAGSEHSRRHCCAFAMREEARNGVLEECPAQPCPDKMRGVTRHAPVAAQVVVTGVHVVGVRKEHLI
jgi:hypothetical protein